MLCLNDRINLILKENQQLTEENAELRGEIVALSLLVEQSRNEKNEKLDTLFESVAALNEEVQGLDKAAEIDTVFEGLAALNEDIEGVFEP